VSILVALTVGLVAWIVLWALGTKADDAFLITIALVLAATAARLLSPFVNQLLGRETETERQMPGGL
jgi:divalent metal cation (Fe/Co/Zn/Cd) transporter